MALFDLPLDQLREYRPERDEPADFDAFWQQTLAESSVDAWSPAFESVESGLSLVEVLDVTFPGYLGQPIKGWLVLPRERRGPLPCVVEYVGYTGGRGLPIEWLTWASAGYAHLVMDTRGQGTGSRRGDTPDQGGSPDGPQYPGFMTRGIESPQTYYYRRVFTDAVHAVAAARAHPSVDPGRVAVTGGSQGGGIALAVAGLVPDLDAVLPDVPFLCHFRRATELVDTHPYREIVEYCRRHRDRAEAAFATLSYVDGVNFAARATAPALFSVGLMDDVCPPSTVFAAYNHYAGEKSIEVWPHNEHEGGEAFQAVAKLAFLAARWGQQADGGGTSRAG